VDKEALGQAGIELLLQDQDEGDPAQVTMPVELVVRESSSDD
jgi:DNA-binding LacI/PurR family transcriptional regulator